MSHSRFRDLPAFTTAFIGVVVCLGCLTIAQSFHQLFVHSISWKWTLLALLTLVSGSATVKLPGLPATVSISETFVFTSVLLFGSAAGTLTAALDALVISFWSYRKGHPLYKILFNLGAVSVTLWVASHIYFALSPYDPLSFAKETIEIGRLIGPLLAFTIAYYALNTGLISFVIALERNAEPLRVWRENFVWIALNYFGGASVALLLVGYTRDLDYSFLVVIVPLLVVLYFTFFMSMGRTEDANKHLSELNSLYIATIETLAMAIDAKDQITHGHIRRVQLFAVGLAKHMGVKDDEQIRAIEAAALLHDMGKLAVPEYILNKPGPLTPAEFEKMKLHASVGADILASIAFPYPVVPIVRHHHENWDGTGYPDKIAGANIPIGARILSVVDCFDALTSDRPYRPRLSDKDALRILVDRRGTMYDPLVVDTFLKVHTTLASEVATQQPSSISLRAIAEAAKPTSSVQLDSQSRFEEIAASSDEMLTLFELARTLSANMGAQDASDLIAKHLRRLVPSSACVFFILDEDNDDLVAAYSSGEHAEMLKGLRIPRGQRLTGWVAANRLTIRNSDPVLDLGESARTMVPRPRSSLSTPLVSGNRLIGVLSLYSSNKEAYSEDHERIIEVIATQVSSVILEAHLTERLRNRSLKDERTGLPNLKHLFEFVNSHLAAPHQSHPFCLIAIRSTSHFSDDISHNETILTGIRRSLRPTDVLFAVGRDELVALLLNTDEPSASGVASRIAISLESLRRDGIITSVTMGIACGPTQAADAAALLSLARNQVTKHITSTNGAIH